MKKKIQKYLLFLVIIGLGKTITAQTSCATAINITVKADDKSCFTGPTTVATSDIGSAVTPVGGCTTADDNQWWGKFTATSTNTEYFMWGKAKDNASIIIYSGTCGSLTQVYCNANTGADDIPSWGQLATVIGQTYYILIHKKMTTAFLCLYNTTTEADKPFCTSGMSFEDGAGSGWTAKTGGYYLVSAPGNVFTWDFANTVPISSPPRLSITSGTGRDPNVGMLKVKAPGGGNYSFRLGQPGTGAGTPLVITYPYSHVVPGATSPFGTPSNNQAGAAMVQYCFTVNANTAGFGYKYACVMDNASHAAAIQPTFEVTLTDQATGDTVPCGKYSHYPGSPTSPFLFVGNDGDVAGQSDLCFTPWTDVLTDLSGYVGKTICVTFRIKDCSGGNATQTNPPNYDIAEAGGHGAYAYIDTYCIPMDITVPEFCAGASSIQICAPPGYKSYSWPSGQPGLTGAPTTQCVTINNPVGGVTYTVNMVSISGCPVTAKVVVKNIPLTVTTPASICAGTSANISVAVTSGTNPPYTFTWSHGLGTGPGPKTVTPAVTTTYTVTVQNGLGCTSTQAVIVNVDPCVPTITTTSGAVCAGNCFNITTTASGGAAPYNYSWNTGASTSALSVCPASTTTYTVTMTDNVGATASATAVVTVNSNPVVSVSPATICNGGSTTLNASGATTYTWSPATGLSATTGSSITASPASTITYTVTGTITATGCTGITTVVVTVNPKPAVSVNPATICQGQTTSLTASGADTYTWSPATGLSATTGATVNANPTASTTYTVTGTITATGCTNTTTVVVTVIPPCGPSVVATGANVCEGVCATVTCTASAGIPPYNYSWNTGATTTSINVCPAATTTYTITVTDNSTPIGTATAIAVVTVNPIPVVSVPAATICAGESKTLTANGAVTYTWSPATGLSATTGTTVTASPTTTITYTVTGTSALGGCTGTTSVIVTVNPSPTISVPAAAICAGTSATLTANGADTYTWTPSTGLSSTTGTTVTASPAATITYTVTGTTTATGCTGTTSVIVTVNSNPVISVPGKSICSGSSAALTASGATTYSWSPATGLNATTGASVTANPATTTTYTVTGTITATGCTGATTVIVTVNPIPTVSVSPATICSGTSKPLTASGATTYTWSPATGLNTTTGATVTASPMTTITYTVTGSNPTGCAGTTTVVITVNPTPVPVISGTTVICDGQSTVLTSSTSGPYSWNTGATSGSITVTPSNTTTYSVSVTQNGCTGTAQTTVTVVPPVTASITGNDICVGESVTLTAHGGSNYSWNTGATTGTITETPAGTSTYTVIVAVGSCADTATYTVIVNPLPTAYASGDTTIFYGQSARLTSGGGGTYQWLPPGGLNCSNCSSPMATPRATTRYCVVIKDTTGCSDSACVTVYVELKCGFEGEIFVPNGFSPNGDGQNDVLYVRGVGITELYWAIYDRWGEKVFETSDPQQGWDGTYKGKNLDPGVFVYYLKATCITGDELSQKGNVSIIK